MLVYITRHGQPLIRPDKETDPEYPRRDPPLSDLGRAQASALGRRLREMGFTGRIYSSPYRRTAATAQRIAEELDTVFYPEPAIREIVKREEQMVGFTGLTLEALRDECPRLALGATLACPWWTPQAEDDDAVLERARPFLEELLTQRDGDAILVGHGASVHAATRFFLAQCENAPAELPPSWNCALTAFRVGELCQALLLRDTAHLLDEQVTSNARGKADGAEPEDGTPMGTGGPAEDEDPS